MPNQYNNTWPGPDDSQAIEAMLDKQHPQHQQHWEMCLTLVNGWVKTEARDFSREEKEDIIQNAIFKIVRSLHDFKRRSRLKTWIITIVRHCIADAGRELKARLKQDHLPFRDLDENEDTSDDDYMLRIKSPKTTEEECILREDMREANEKLWEYLSKHTNKERNIRIIEKYIDGWSQEEIAHELHMPTPNVGYIIRSIRKYLGGQQ